MDDLPRLRRQKDPVELRDVDAQADRDVISIAALLGLRYRDEVAAGAAAVDDLVGDALIVETEMTTGLAKRRIEDGVVDNDLGHKFLTSSCLAAARR
jgi:hypothetical protein